MVVCGSCGSALDVSVPGEAQLLHEFETARRSGSRPPIALGAKGRHKGKEWEAIGRIRWVQREDGETWRWDEIQLRADDGRPAYLTLENGHWTWSEPVRRKISTDPRGLSPPGGRVHAWGKTYRCFERGACAVEFVEGELTWVAARGDRTEFMDAVAPPEMVSAEWTGQEMEWSIGKWLPPEEVAEIFGIPPERMPAPVGVAPHQPFAQDPSQERKVKWGLAFGFLLLVVALAAAVWSGEKVFEAAVSPAEYLSENGALTPPFELPLGRHICRLEVRADVNNAWVAVDVGVVDETEDVLVQADGEMEYYHGRDSDGRWSEGNGRDSTLFRLDGPGPYRLAVFGSAGNWPEGGPTPRHDVHLVLRRGVFPVRYALLGSILAFLFPLREAGRYLAHRGAQQPETDD